MGIGHFPQKSAVISGSFAEKMTCNLRHPMSLLTLYLQQQICFGHMCTPSRFWGNTLQSNATHCNALQHIATYCNYWSHLCWFTSSCDPENAVSPATRCSTLNCNTLQHTATRCSTLNCNTLQHTELQHTATHCNTLQHTATHYIYLLHLSQFAGQCNPENAALNASKYGNALNCNTLQHTATHCSYLVHLS